MGLAGVLLGLGLLVWLAYRGWSVLLLAPLAALVAAAFAGEPLLARWTQTFMASVPTYMMWDDHDIRDGWASVATDSPTLAGRYSRGRELFSKNNAYFEDARDVYWHFQGCHNPTPTGDRSLPNYIDGPPSPGQRRAMPFVFRCGRLVVLVLDARGDRDVFRKDYPILGTEQWGFIDTVFTNLPADVEALAVMTPTPIASMDPNGQVQNLLGDRTDDVVAFNQDRRGLIFLSGDIHVGCIFDISCSKPEFKAASLTASGISAKEDQAVIVGTFLDEDFTVAPGSARRCERSHGTSTSASSR